MFSRTFVVLKPERIAWQALKKVPRQLNAAVIMIFMPEYAENFGKRTATVNGILCHLEYVYFRISNQRIQVIRPINPDVSFSPVIDSLLRNLGGGKFLFRNLISR